MALKSIQQEFIRSVETGDLSRAQALLEAGADVNFRGSDPDATSPLCQAVTANQLNVVQLLLRAGADVNSAGKLSGWTPLMLAHNNPEVTRALIAGGASPNSRTPAREVFSPGKGGAVKRGGDTALHFAAACNNWETVKLLAQAGAEIEARNEEGLAPLDVALARGASSKAAEVLIDAGAALTPERLDLAHSAGHSPDSDLWQFPWSSQENPNHPLSGPHVALNRRSTALQTAPTDAGSSPSEFRCPQCHSLLYSRKSKLCGKCGALIPPELRLSDQEARASQQERKWARDLANSFGSIAFDNTQAAAGAPITPGSVSDFLKPTDLVRRVSCAAEFKNRDRPDFWLYLALNITMACISMAILAKLGTAQPMALSLIGGVFAFYVFRGWNRAAPICPSCKNNIRKCGAVYCHICGEHMQGRTCPRCASDNAFLHLAFPRLTGANSHRITYCPACGVYLDTSVWRWRPKANPMHL